MKHGLWLAILATACGGGGGDDTAGPDAPPAADGAPTTGTVTIKLIGAMNIADLPVSVAGPDGTVISTTKTDATGTATATVTAGDSVTYALDAKTIITELDVHPGDTLGADLTAIQTADPTGAFVNVSAMTNANADHYTVSAGRQSKGDISPPALLKLQLDQNITRYDLLAYAYKVNQDAPIAFATDFDRTPPSGSIPTVALGGWRTDFDTITLGITNAPPHAGTAAFDLVPFIGDRDFTGTDVEKTFSNGSVGLSNIVAKGAWTSYLYRTGVTSSASPASSTAKIDRLAQLQGLVTIDYGAQMLPFVTSASIDMPAGHTTPTIHMATEPATSAAPIGFLAQFTYQTAAQVDIRQLVVAPPGTSWDLPHLGDNQAAYVAPTTGFAAVLEIAVAAGGTVWPDAASFRGNWLAPVTNPLSIQGSVLLSQLSGP